MEAKEQRRQKGKQAPEQRPQKKISDEKKENEAKEQRRGVEKKYLKED